MTNEMLSGYAIGLSLMNSYDTDSFYLYCQGCLATNKCGSIIGTINSENSISSFTAGNNNLDVKVYGEGSYGTITIANKINLTEFNRLCVSYTGNSSFSKTTELGVSTGHRSESYLAVLDNSTVVAKLDLTADSEVTQSLDVSELSGSYSIVFHIGDLTPNKGLQETLSFLIHSIYLGH